MKELPAHLAALVRQANAGALTGSLELPSGIVPDLGRYITSWALAVLTGDRAEALRRLEEAHAAHQAATERAGEQPGAPERPAKPFDKRGLSFRPCRSCKTSITFVPGSRGSKIPVELDGTPHWANCPDATAWRQA